MSKRNSKPKRKRKTAGAKHIVVTAPLKIHIHPEIVPTINTSHGATNAGTTLWVNPLAAKDAALMDKVNPRVEPLPKPWWKFWA